MTSISAVIVAQDEEHRIGGAIRSVLPWVDEVLVVDGGSRDRTAGLSADLGARVVDRAFDGFVTSKQAATDAATHDLVFGLDADERLDEVLGAAVRSARLGAGPVAWRVARLNYLDGRPLRASGWYPDRRVRLFDRRAARGGGREPHDRVLVDGAVGDLAGHLHHDPERTTAAYRRATVSHAERAAHTIAASGRPGALTPALHGVAHLLRKATVGRCWLDGRRGWTVARVGAAGASLKYRRAREIAR